MRKILMLSVLAASVAGPTFAANDNNKLMINTSNGDCMIIGSNSNPVLLNGGCENYTNGYSEKDVKNRQRFPQPTESSPTS